ncbi:sigma-70 family RNA polymerase sigma factor [Rhodoplanes sp. Z2-YC6860]|uniref:sigma-70 family RNA polymerase sigma factor n=1 Tax=Rhodoplanes sp. Z2-YC6860 TaxID=674703 RepID=UPI00078DD2CD|nr:sigma-70 family RNA polymerase sigma factor [Rhodoplanes sp. Z2-YC6860]AMN43368.1 RNA polymerase sigma factor, sigma-70 family [Rhodoplanes sp. Z2-YC6860]
MRTQLCLENTAKASHRSLRTTSVTSSAGSLPASQQIAVVASKRDAVVDAKPEKRTERPLRDVVLVHLDDLYTYARFLLLKPADAEDAVHECYLKAMMNIDDYRDATAKLWLLKILRMVCVREILQRGDSDLGDQKSSLTVASANDPSAAEPPNVNAETAVQALIASLPLSLRETIVLRECIRLSCSEIAAVTGASDSVVNKRLARAREMLLDRGALSRRSKI